MAFGVAALLVGAPKSQAQVRVVGAGAYGGNYGGAINNSYSYPGIGGAYNNMSALGAGGYYGTGSFPGFSSLGGYYGAGSYFNGLNGGYNYGNALNNGYGYGYGNGNAYAGVGNGGYGYNNPYSGLPNGYYAGSNDTSINGAGNTGTPYIGAGGYYGGGSYSDPSFAAGPNGVTPLADGNGVAYPMANNGGVYVVHGPTGLRDSIDVDRPTNTQVKISWTGDPRPIKQMTFSVLDSSRQTLKSQVITKTPAQATFTRGKTASYYRVYIEYLDGAVRTLTAPL